MEKTKNRNPVSINVAVRADSRVIPNTFTTANLGNTEYENESLTCGNGGRSFHKCIHDRVRVKQTFRSGIGTTKGKPGEVRWTNYPTMEFASGPSSLPPSDFLPHGEIDWRGAYETILNSATGVMPISVAVGQNIAEITSLKKLVPSILESLLNIKRLAQNSAGHVYRGGKKFPVRDLKWGLKDISNTHLAVVFGVLPLVSDIKHFMQLSDSVNRRLKHIQGMERRSVRLRARAPAVPSTSASSSWQVVGKYSIDGGTIERSTEVKYALLTANCRVRLKTPAKVSRAYFRQCVGLNAPLSLAWELIPFSFVVDWFLPIGETIERLEPSRAAGSAVSSYELTEWTNTTKIHATFNYQQTYASPVNPLGAYQDKYTQMGSVAAEYTFYGRTEGMPSLNFLPNAPKGFGLAKSLLGLSLIIQKIVK